MNLLQSVTAFLCEQHFISNDYTFGDSWHLQENAIPTDFHFPLHLKKSGKKTTREKKT